MKRRLRVFLGMTAVLIMAPPVWAGGRCQDIPTVWTLSSSQLVDGITTPARIYSDGQPYADSVSTGISAKIMICSGTYDAVLTVGSGRTIMFNLTGAYLLDSSYPPPPAWTANGPFASTPSSVKNCSGGPCTLLNVRNILNFGSAPRTQYYKLYTRLASALVAPDKFSYHLPMHNPTTSDVASNSNDAFVNSPFQNARVVVEHYPASQAPDECAAKECWVVYPETPLVNGSLSASPENATLVSNDQAVNYGQFSVPFHFTIAVK